MKTLGIRNKNLYTKPDGTADLTVPAYHPMEVIPKVLQFGVEAELLEPKKARLLIKELVQTLCSALLIS